MAPVILKDQFDNILEILVENGMVSITINQPKFGTQTVCKFLPESALNFAKKIVEAAETLTLSNEVE